MTKKITYFTIIITVLLAALFSGCPMALNPIDSANIKPSEPKIETGITITIPRYAPWIIAAAGSNARAFAFTDAVEIIVKNSTDVEIFNNTFNPGGPDGSGSISCSAELAPGTGYSLTVNIFNNNNSTTVPVVSGTATGIDVTSGNATSVTVTCLPVNPEIAIEGETYAFTNVIPMTVDGNGQPTSTGGELWYQITGPSTGYIDLTVDVPAGISYYVISFDSNGLSGGNPLMGGPGLQTIPVVVPTDQICYLVIAPVSSNSIPVSGSVRWVEATPNYLTNVDVPDAELRELMEYYTGKVFTAGSNQIADLDLASISSFITYAEDGHGDYTGITDLTGLDYCSNLTSLSLSGNNLSTADLTVVSGMNNLRSIDLWGSHLQNLAFLSGMNQLGKITVCDNPDLSYTDIISLNSTNFPALHDLEISAYDTTGDHIIDQISGSDWTNIVAMINNHSQLTLLTLGGFGCTTSMVNELLSVITANVLRWEELSFSFFDTFGQDGITDLSWVTGLANIKYLGFNGNSSITDLGPLQTLESAGGFSEKVNWRDIDLNITNCNLELWPGNPNRTVVDYLINHGVRVDYLEGNELAAPTPTSLLYSGGYIKSIYEYDGTSGGNDELISGFDNDVRAVFYQTASFYYVSENSGTKVYQMISGTANDVEITGFDYIDWDSSLYNVGGTWYYSTHEEESFQGLGLYQMVSGSDNDIEVTGFDNRFGQNSNGPYFYHDGADWFYTDNLNDESGYGIYKMIKVDGELNGDQTNDVLLAGFDYGESLRISSQTVGGKIYYNGNSTGERWYEYNKSTADTLLTGFDVAPDGMQILEVGSDYYYVHNRQVFRKVYGALDDLKYTAVETDDLILNIFGNETSSFFIKYYDMNLYQIHDSSADTLVTGFDNSISNFGAFDGTDFYYLWDDPNDGSRAIYKKVGTEPNETGSDDILITGLDHHLTHPAYSFCVVDNSFYYSYGGNIMEIVGTENNFTGSNDIVSATAGSGIMIGHFVNYGGQFYYSDRDNNNIYKVVSGGSDELVFDGSKIDGDMMTFILRL